MIIQRLKKILRNKKINYIVVNKVNKNMKGYKYKHRFNDMEGFETFRIISDPENIRKFRILKCKN